MPRAMPTLREIEAEKSLAAVTIDRYGLVTYVNDAFVSLFGWSRRELLGRPISIIIPDGMRDAHNLGFSRHLMTGESTVLGRPVRVRALAKDGRTFMAEHKIVGEKRGGAWVFGATIEPV